MYYFIFLIFLSLVLNGVNDLPEFLRANKNFSEQELSTAVEEGVVKYSPQVLVALIEEGEATLFPLKKLAGKMGWCSDDSYLVDHPQLQLLPMASKVNLLGVSTSGDFRNKKLRKEEITLLNLACLIQPAIGESVNPETVFIIGVNSSDYPNNFIVKNDDEVKKKLEKINRYMADEKKHYQEELFSKEYKVFFINQEEKEIEQYIKENAILKILKINSEGFFEIKDEEIIND